MPTQRGNMRRALTYLPAAPRAESAQRHPLAWLGNAVRSPCKWRTVRTARSAKLQPAADVDADVDAGTGLTWALAVFRKDRDFGRIQSERGGGFIVAVSRTFCCTVIRLLNDDSLLDQLALTVSGSSGKISIVASYVPPGWITHIVLQQSQMAGQDAELGNLAFTHLAGRHLSRIGERLPGAVVSLHE
nr:uncharacterized protein LOC118878847 [Drosophila suzukii]